MSLLCMHDDDTDLSTGGICLFVFGLFGGMVSVLGPGVGLDLDGWLGMGLERGRGVEGLVIAWDTLRQHARACVPELKSGCFVVCLGRCLWVCV